MKTAEKIDQDYWLNSGVVFLKLIKFYSIILEPYKLGIALFVIKPDLVASGKKDEILNHVNN
jgi:hypothetical protein